MKTGNHYEMGKLIQKKMADSNMPLNKFLFIIGNLAPDLTVSYLFRQHSYNLCWPWFSRLIGRIYKRKAASSHMRFSFLLGVASHFICDFFCYPHSNEYSGSTLDHIRYESNQLVNADNLLPFEKKRSTHTSCTALLHGIDKYINGYEMSLSRLSDHAEISVIDVQQAARVTMWVATSIYLYSAHNHVSKAKSWIHTPPLRTTTSAR